LLPELEQLHSALDKDVREMESKRQSLVTSSHNLENMIKVADKKLQFYNYETEIKKTVLLVLKG
jgi:hypothetical protein